MIYLIDTDYLRSNATSLDANISDKYLLQTILEVQDIKLQQYLGTRLYRSLLEKVDNNDVDGIYKTLLDDYITYFLQYEVLSELVFVTSYKTGNAGTVEATDEKLTQVRMNEIVLLKNFYEKKANFYAKRLVNFLVENIRSIEELSDNCGCSYDIQPNLDKNSIESVGLWLGGKRNVNTSHINKITKKHCCR